MTHTTPTITDDRCTWTETPTPTARANRVTAISHTALRILGTRDTWHVTTVTTHVIDGAEVTQVTTWNTPGTLLRNRIARDTAPTEQPASAPRPITRADLDAAYDHALTVGARLNVTEEYAQALDAMYDHLAALLTPTTPAS